MYFRASGLPSRLFRRSEYGLAQYHARNSLFGPNNEHLDYREEIMLAAETKITIVTIVTNLLSAS